jgi:ABC-2 type transport system permease protein
VRLWLEIARRGYRRSAAYRGATIGGLATNTAFGFMRAYIVLALYRENTIVRGYEPIDAVAYAWLTQGLLVITMIWGETQIAERIRTGDIATDLYRPVDFQAYQLAYDAGRAWYLIAFRGIAPVAIGAISFGIRMPERPTTWLLLMVALALAVVVSSQLRFLVNLSAFWLLDHRGVVAIASTVIMLLSGFIVPLAFLPPWAESLARALPFAAMLQVPNDVFLERPEVWSGIATQFLWSGILIVSARTVLSAARRKVVIQGG